MVSTEARRIQRNPEAKAVLPTGRTERQTTEGHEIKKVFVCSPFRPVGDTKEERDEDWKRNINLAKQACHYAVKKGYIPYAPHLYFPEFLSENDPDEREMGITLGLTWLARCDEIWVAGTRISEGMKKEIAQAKEWHIPMKAYLPLLGDRTRVFEADFLTEDEFMKLNTKTEKEDAMDKKKPERMTVEELVKAMDEDAKHIGLTIADLYRTATMAMASLPNMELRTELICLSVTEHGITVHVGHDCRGCHECDDDYDDYDEDDMNDFEEGENGIYDEF